MRLEVFPGSHSAGSRLRRPCGGAPPPGALQSLGLLAATLKAGQGGRTGRFCAESGIKSAWCGLLVTSEQEPPGFPPGRKTRTIYVHAGSQRRSLESMFLLKTEE